MTTNCWSCGGDTAGPRRVVGPVPALVICERCIIEPHPETGNMAQNLSCVFCGTQLGKPRGWFRRRPPLRIGIQRGDQVTCEECLLLMRDIVAEWENTTWERHDAV